MRCDIATLANIFDVTPRSIRMDMQADKAFPIAKKGKAGEAYEFESAAVIKWKIARAIEKAAKKKRALAPAENRSALDRKREAEAQSAELELQIKRGEVVAVADVMPVVCEEMAALRSALLAIHRQFKDPLISRRVDDAIREALTVFVADQQGFELKDG